MSPCFICEGKETVALPVVPPPVGDCTTKLIKLLFWFVAQALVLLFRSAEVGNFS